MSSISGGNIAGGNPRLGRIKDDYYATNPKDSKAFFDLIKDDYQFKTIIEPAAGGGHLLDQIKLAFPDSEIKGYDLIDRGRKDIITPVNYLESDFKADAIITNPPFTLAKEFVEKALTQANTVIIFAKLQWLEGQRRKEFLENSPLKYVYVYSFRATPWPNGNRLNSKGKPWGSTMAFAWYIFEKGYKGEPKIRWI